MLYYKLSHGQAILCDGMHMTNKGYFWQLSKNRCWEQQCLKSYRFHLTWANPHSPNTETKTTQIKIWWIGGYNLTDIIISIKYGLWLAGIGAVSMLLSGNIRLSLLWSYGEFYFYFKYIVLELSVCAIYIGTQMVYIALNIVCSKTTDSSCIFPKLDCRGCSCISVDFDVFGVYLSGAVKWGSQVRLPKTKNYLLRQKTLIEDNC